MLTPLTDFEIREVYKNFLNPFLWTEPPVNPHNGIVEQIGLTSHKKYERYATSRIETFAIFRSKGIHFLQNDENMSKVNWINCSHQIQIDSMYNDRMSLFGNCLSWLQFPPLTIIVPGCL